MDTERFFVKRPHRPPLLMYRCPVGWFALDGATGATLAGPEESVDDAIRGADLALT